MAAEPVNVCTEAELTKSSVVTLSPASESLTVPVTLMGTGLPVNAKVLPGAVLPTGEVIVTTGDRSISTLLIAETAATLADETERSKIVCAPPVNDTEVETLDAAVPVSVV